MKKLLLISALSLFASASYAESTWTCYRYVNDSPTGTWIKVKASSKSEAESKAYVKMKDNGGQVDYAKCS